MELRYLKCRHSAVISEKGLKVGHNSAGPGQDLSQEQVKEEGKKGGGERKEKQGGLQCKD